MVDATGVRLQPSDVAATSRNRLLGVTTDYDWMPLFGGYARDRAMQEYRAKQDRARSEIESRVAFDAEESLDRETHEVMENARKNLYDRFTDRFDEYGIKLTTVEMKSTPERVVARVRVAGEDQLGSHTPRPRALSDSLASVQVHESAMNNLAVTLGLDGKRYTAAELQTTLRERFPKLVVKDPPDARHDTVFEFVPKDAVQIRITDGKLELRIAFASVELEGDVMPDVIVHSFYTPAVDGMTAELARDGALGIEGRFSAGERARLHNIFKNDVAARTAPAARPPRRPERQNFPRPDDHAARPGRWLDRLGDRPRIQRTASPSAPARSARHIADPIGRNRRLSTAITDAARARLFPILRRGKFLAHPLPPGLHPLLRRAIAAYPRSR